MNNLKKESDLKIKEKAVFQKEWSNQLQVLAAGWTAKYLRWHGEENEVEMAYATK